MPFLRWLSALLLLTCLGARPALADRVRLLTTAREAAEARAELVLGAREEVLASSFIFGGDPFTLTSLALLRDAARRGVRVRLIVDAQWNGIPRAVQAHLLAEGVEIREYHPFNPLRPGWLARRMHDKLAVADGRVLLAGGRNVASPYFGLGRQIRARDYVDCDLAVEGDAAREARDYFQRLWLSREVRRIAPRATPAELAEARVRLDGYQSWLDARVAEALADPERRPAAWREAGPVRLLHDPVGRKGRQPGVAEALGELLARARTSAVIESPYLIPTRGFRKLLREALARGVHVHVLTNSLASTDNLWAQAGYVGRKGELVREGVELWEYQGPESLHAKVAVFDGETTVVGSFNLDPRSERLNTELALVASDPALAAELGQILDSHLARAVRIDTRGYPEGAAEPYPGIPRARIRKLRLFELLAPLIRSQL